MGPLLTDAPWTEDSQLWRTWGKNQGQGHKNPEAKDKHKNNCSRGQEIKKWGNN